MRVDLWSDEVWIGPAGWGPLIVGPVNWKGWASIILLAALFFIPAWIVGPSHRLDLIGVLVHIPAFVLLAIIAPHCRLKEPRNLDHVFPHDR